jgi:hypothetical protein
MLILRRAVPAALVAAAFAFPANAAADRGPYPHDFNQNMGYCAPYLAQLRLPDGSPVRPFINHTVQNLTQGDQTWLGFENFGDFAGAKAHSTTDTQCLQRQL